MPENTYIDESLQLVKIIYQLKEGGVVSEPDMSLLNQWRERSEANEQLFENLMNRSFQLEGIKELRSLDIESFSSNLVTRAKELPAGNLTIRKSTSRQSIVKPIYKIAVAASLLVAVLGTYWYFSQRKNADMVSVQREKQVIPAASDKATLKLANGKIVILDSVQDGQLAYEGHSSIQKEKDQLVYDGNDEAGSMNVLEIPKGGKFKLTLADGTKVWMNSASSLTYPTSFKKGEDRIIALSGEAYFEVANNKSMPFKVRVNDMEVKVTGTHFNINAYADEEDIRTTLLEGGVEVTKNDKTKTLTPGQQATVKKSANTLNVNAANLTQVVAWKDGLFIFDEKEVTEILREISRWYDVEFEYKTAPGKATYSGVINRNISLNELLDVLKDSRVFNYRLVGRKVTILPL